MLSFWVKTAKKYQTVTLVGVSQIEHTGDSSRELMQMTSSDEYEVGNEWVHIVHEFSVETEGRPAISYAFLFMIQHNLNEKRSNMYDLLTDNWSLVKKGSYVEVTPEPDIEIPLPEKVSAQTRGKSTQIGAMYYNPWTGTSDEWKEDGVIKNTNDETARSLSPSQFHYMAPFYADVDKSTGRVIFPTQTEAQWKEEMQYAIGGGLDYITYIWSNMINASSNPIKWHIANTEINSKLKMCAMLETVETLSTEGRSALFQAMKSDYYLKYNDMPVVFIYGTSNITDRAISFLRKKAALDGVTSPLYVAGMGFMNKNAALAGAGNGVNAASFYAAGAQAKGESYKTLCEYSLSLHEKLLGVKSVMSIIPMATMGRNNNPRIVTPVSWSPGTGGSEPYGGFYTKDGTPEELAGQLVDMLNWNKKNADVCRPNIITIYAWNEHDEGGWLCPTLQCDDNGNVQYESNGTPKRNTSHIDAVKTAIDAYRKYEQYPTVMVDAKGNITAGSVDDVVTPIPGEETAIPGADVTAAPSNDDKAKGTSWVVWVIVAAAVVIIGGAVAAVIIVRKKKAVLPQDGQDEKAEETSKENDGE